MSSATLVVLDIHLLKLLNWKPSWLNCVLTSCVLVGLAQLLAALLIKMILYSSCLKPFYKILLKLLKTIIPMLTYVLISQILIQNMIRKSQTWNDISTLTGWCLCFVYYAVLCAWLTRKIVSFQCSRVKIGCIVSIFSYNYSWYSWYHHSFWWYKKFFFE